MSTDEVLALRRDLNSLRDTVLNWIETSGQKINIIHSTVLEMAKKTYVPSALRTSTSSARTRRQPKSLARAPKVRA